MARTAKTSKKVKLTLKNTRSVLAFMSSNDIFDMSLNDNTKGNPNGWFSCGDITGVISADLTSQIKDGDSDVNIENLAISDSYAEGEEDFNLMLHGRSTKYEIGRLKFDGGSISFKRK